MIVHDFFGIKSNFMTAKLNLLLLKLANSYPKLIFPLLKLRHLISSSKLGTNIGVRFDLKI